MFRKRILAIGVIALVALGGTVALDVSAPFAYLRTRNLLRDAITRAGRKTPANPDLVFLAIDSDSVGLEEGADIDEMYELHDNDSIEARGLHAMSKLWPWPREVYGLVLERLVEAGAKVVIFDLTFPTPTAGDEPFHLALEKYRDHAVIGSNFISATSRGFTTVSASHTRPPDSLVPQTKPMDDRVAFTNFWPDDDDVVRRVQYRITFEQVQGLQPGAESERFLSLGGRALAKAGYKDLIPAGLEDRMFRYTAPAREGFPPRSLFEIFVPDYWKHNYKSGEFFRGKIVLVGAEGNWQHDEHATPFGAMPGPELHLNAINAAIHHEFITELSHGSVLFVAVLAGLIALALSVGVRSPWLRLLILLALDCADVWLTLYAFNNRNVYIPCLPFLLVLNSTVLLGFICDFTWERLEKARVRRTLEKYVSNNVVRELLDHPRQFQQSLGGVVKPASILFSDIRGYSSVSAKTNPQALVAQLNEYLSAMVECVFRHGGTLDKFIGDAVMAVWGNVQSEGVTTDATNAVRAGLEMREELVRLNREWRKRGLTELRIGIAINQGDVVVGNVGSPRRMEFTVIGDPVNVSWKLQELTKQVESDLVVSKSVSALVLEHFELQNLGKFPVTGFDEPFEIFGISRPIAVGEAVETATLAAR
ncbi:MAG: adenylate/guanylate cyclase domain-containing protein [Verrucomicrobiota bacterium]|nr:adenylate/guanylate cyclase domain-containing protein [Verrucomicrobiota bacterium]